MKIVLHDLDARFDEIIASKCDPHHPGGREIRALPGLLRLLDKASSRV